MNQELLKVENLEIFFPFGKRGLWGKPKKYVRAVDGISFSVKQGSTLGIVGESGCGKSTLVRGILRLIPVTSGKVTLNGTNVLALKEKELREFRQNFQLIFQDPEASLNPRMTVGEIIAEPIKVYQPHLSRKELQQRVQELMDQVGLRPAMIRRFPHEFSGGQRQRICIARSISINPYLLVCDEAVSALDVSIQAQVINLLKKIKKENNLTYLFISHDLAVVRHISDEVMVLYLGHVMEKASTEEIISRPKHPYTKALISAVPEYHHITKKGHQQITLQGDIPSPINPPPGCPFSTRCPLVKPHCREGVPEPTDRGNGHWVACYEV